MSCCQGKSTTGKQGLGIKDRPKKVAGCYFEGKKTSFSDSDDEDSADIGSEEKQTHDLIKEEKTDESRVKLKKLCKQILRRVSYFCCWNFLMSWKLFSSLIRGLIPGAWRIIETETA